MDEVVREEYILLDFDGQLDYDDTLKRILQGQAQFAVDGDGIVLRDGERVFRAQVADSLCTDVTALISPEGDIQVVGTSRERLLLDQRSS